MIKEAIQFLQESGHAEDRFVDGRHYTTRQVFPVKPPVCETTKLTTLQGVVDFIKAEDPVVSFIHVSSPTTVHVYGPIVTPWMVRELFVVSSWNQGVFRFGQWLDQEKFIIDVNSLFVQTDQTVSLLRFVSGLQDNSSAKIRDDGISQTTAVKVGIASLAEASIDNPIFLRPFRTFVEVDQPDGLFVFRMQRREGQPPTCALFEADGGMWQVSAMKTIKEWLMSALPDYNVVM